MTSSKPWSISPNASDAASRTSCSSFSRVSVHGPVPTPASVGLIVSRVRWIIGVIESLITWAAAADAAASKHEAVAAESVLEVTS